MESLHLVDQGDPETIVDLVHSFTRTKWMCYVEIPTRLALAKLVGERHEKGGRERSVGIGAGRGASWPVHPSTGGT